MSSFPDIPTIPEFSAVQTGASRRPDDILTVGLPDNFCLDLLTTVNDFRAHAEQNAPNRELQKLLTNLRPLVLKIDRGFKFGDDIFSLIQNCPQDPIDFSEGFWSKAKKLGQREDFFGAICVRYSKHLASRVFNLEDFFDWLRKTFPG